MHASASIVHGPAVTSHIRSMDGGAVVLDGVGDGPEDSPVYNKRFGESAIGSLTTSGVAAERKRSATWPGVKFGSFCRRRAAAPDTCGHAIDVPLIVALELSDDTPADVIEEPGAKMSRHDPWLLYPARVSSHPVAPTVMAELTCAGEKLQASWLSLPAATTTTTPAAVALSIAVSTKPMFPEPPKLALKTAGR